MASEKNQEDRPYVVGMDLGGTKILAAVVDAEGNVVGEAKKKTRAKKGPDKVIERMARTAKKAVKQAGVSWDEVWAVGVGAPGPIDPEAGIVYTPPNLPGWEQVALGPRLSEQLGVPVCVENDVNLGTLGEYTFGAGRGTRDMVGVFVGTGIGGGLILDGKLRAGVRGSAGEVVAGVSAAWAAVAAATAVSTMARRGWEAISSLLSDGVRLRGQTPAAGRRFGPIAAGRF